MTSYQCIIVGSGIAAFQLAENSSGKSRVLMITKSIVEEIQLLFMLQVAKLVTSAALTREESRGAHIRADFPVQSENWNDVHLIHSQKGIEKRELYEHHQIKVNA